MSKESKPDSIPQKQSGFIVGASPLNPVKLELGAILIIATALVLIIDYVSHSRTVQIAVLAGYGMFAMSWLMFRVKRLLQLEQVAAKNTADDQFKSVVNSDADGKI